MSDGVLDEPAAGGVVEDGYFLVGTKDGCVFPLPAEPRAAMRVGPSDRLIITFAAGALTPELAKAFQETLRERGLDGRVVLVSGAETLAVIEDDPDRYTPKETT